ncbi:hypothetical protein CKO38_10920 [Rhodospirillum rubrum]|uniref:phosphoribosyltransferase n=1 Tax=Rhodospirillum rubrum TaxID=1085 RepID=UPI0019058048|nr:phosphoribosyltransferase family protein [Rhodospirillum rubrum]MBK1665297.1 hypothetical protein [Rhodospirillum rubrum]MBK1677166.1 hypothetical protein [Rhodospirillum rubrum]
MTTPPFTPSPAEDPPVVSMTWDDVTQAIDLLAVPLANTPFDVVAGIARSGLVPAVILAHRFGIRDFSVLDIERTQSDAIHAHKVSPTLIGLFNAPLLEGRHVLLVDDIVGEGLTMRAARALLTSRAKTVSTCCLVVNKGNFKGERITEVVDHFGCVTHSWVRFPWENSL